MLDLVTLAGTIENLLLKNNVTTSAYDISKQLNTRIVESYKGVKGMSERLPVLVSRYPVFFVEMTAKGEEYATLGRAGRRKAQVSYSIVSVTQAGCGSGTDDTRALENAHMENLRMTQNVEHLLRNKPKLSTTANEIDNQVLVNDLVATEYFVQQNESTYNVMSRISCRAEIYT